MFTSNDSLSDTFIDVSSNCTVPCRAKSWIAGAFDKYRYLSRKFANYVARSQCRVAGKPGGPRWNDTGPMGTVSREIYQRSPRSIEYRVTIGLRLSDLPFAFIFCRLGNTGAKEKGRVNGKTLVFSHVYATCVGTGLFTCRKCLLDFPLWSSCFHVLFLHLSRQTLLSNKQWDTWVRSNFKGTEIACFRLDLFFFINCDRSTLQLYNRTAIILLKVMRRQTS